jgi:pyruvate dehydrogenase E2 component (dihydrolipoamide acetyltransferase)
MATNVILPALGMAQDNGTIVRWLKDEGERVTKGEPIAEIETDKATLEIEAPASGVLTGIAAAAGEVVPVGQVIAHITSPGEDMPAGTTAPPAPAAANSSPAPARAAPGEQRDGTLASPLASRIAAEHQLDLRLVPASGRRIQKADVMSYLQSREQDNDRRKFGAPATSAARLLPASPKARRLAFEYGLDLAAISGSGPDGAVLSADVRAAASTAPTGTPAEAPTGVGEAIAAPVEMELVGEPAPAATASELSVGTIWRIMAERTTQSWTSTPHFYLVREVNASRLVAWREQVQRRVEAGGAKITYTDLLVKVVAAALREHPRVNASWQAGKIILHNEVHIGLAVAVEGPGEQGLVVPVIHHADRLSLREIAARRQELLAQAQAGKLRPADLQGGTFTISNLGMYGVDAFNAIINQPQAAILAVGRIVERVVPLHGQPAVQPVMVLTLSCDHRAIDGARGAQFLSTLADLLEEPLGLLT